MVRVGIQPFPASGNLRLDFRFAKMRTTATSCRVLNPGIVSAKTKGHPDGVPIRDYKKLINLMGTPASGKSLEVMKLRGFCYVKQHYIEI